jgi:hypothetical protein
MNHSSARHLFYITERRAAVADDAAERQGSHNAAKLAGLPELQVALQPDDLRDESA